MSDDGKIWYGQIIAQYGKVRLWHNMLMSDDGTIWYGQMMAQYGNVR